MSPGRNRMKKADRRSHRGQGVRPEVPRRSLTLEQWFSIREDTFTVTTIPPASIWQCLEMILVVTGGNGIAPGTQWVGATKVLSSSRSVGRKVLTILQCTGQLPKTKNSPAPNAHSAEGEMSDLEGWPTQRMCTMKLCNLPNSVQGFSACTRAHTHLCALQASPSSSAWQGSARGLPIWFLGLKFWWILKTL